MTIIAIDPGDKQSAAVRYDPLSKTVVESRYADNPSVKTWLRLIRGNQTLVIEMIASYGMPVGQEVFETCVWIGRFAEAWGDAHFLYRKDVKMHLCGSMRAKDGNVRAALLDKFGGAKARGTKRTPGPLWGISGDKWSALALAIFFSETHLTAPHQNPDLSAETAA